MSPDAGAIRCAALAVTLWLLWAAGPAAAAELTGCTPPTDGRVALWRGDDNARDGVGGHDASLENGGGYRAGAVGRAFSLAGSDDYLRVPDGPDLRLLGDLSFDAWVQIDDENFGAADAFGVGGDRVIVTKPNATDSAVSFALWIEGDSPRTAAAAPLAFAGGARSDPTTVVMSDPLAWRQGRWYHLAVVRSGSLVRFFRDGVPVGAATIGGTPADTSGAPVALGASPAEGTILNPLMGGLDEAGLWSRALAAGEVAALHEAVTGLCAGVVPTPPAAVPVAPAASEPPVATAAPVARIAAPVIAGRHVVFDARASTDVTRYRWDLDGDERPDADCGTQPRLTTTVANLAANREVLLVVDGATGTNATATATAPRLPAPRTRARAAQLRGSQYADFFSCDGAVSREDLTENGGPPPGCDTRVGFGLVEAQGCLSKVATRAELRAPVIDALRREASENAELRAYLGGEIAGSTARASQTQTLPTPRIDLEEALDLGEFYTSDRPVRINGLDFYPRDGTDIVLSAALRYVIAENAAVRLEGALIRTGSLVLNVAESRNQVDVGDVNLGETSTAGGGDVRRPRLGGFPLSPQARVTFVRLGASRVSRIAAHVDLGGSGLTLDDGRAPALDATLIATNDEALALRPLTGRLERVRAGRWPIRDGDLAFAPSAPAGRQCNLDALGTGPLWTMAGDLLLTGLEGLGLELTPPPFNGICFQNGRFKSAGATLGPPVLPVPVGPGILLEQIGMNLEVDPSVLRGKALLSGAGIFTLDGRIVAAFPSAGARFRFGPGDMPALPKGFDGEYIDPVFGVGGQLGVRLPFLGTISLVNAGFVYAYPAAIGFKAQLAKADGSPHDFLGILQVRADVDGAINFENGRFNFVGSARACVVDTICGGALAVFSNVGVGACVEVAGVNLGGGVQFPDKVFLWPLDGCKWTRFTEENVRARAAQAAQSYEVSVDETRGSRAIELRGDDQAPIVRVVGPDGEAVELPAGSNHAVGRRIRIMRSPRHKMTTVGLQDPLRGTYRIERLADSARFAAIATALDPGSASVTAELDDDALPRLSASAAQAGGQMALRYEIERRPGQTVTFLDGGRILGAVRGGGRGILRFTLPPDGRVHRIVARPALGGVTVPGEDRVVARVRTRRPELRRPSALRATRRGAALVVRWRGGGARHTVVVRERGGRTRSVTTRRRVVRIRVSRAQPGTVSVWVLDALQRPGPAVGTRFRAAAQPRTRFLPYSVLRGPRR